MKDIFDNDINSKILPEYKEFVKRGREICNECNIPIGEDIEWSISRMYNSYGRTYEYNYRIPRININSVYFKKKTKKYKRYLLSTIVHELIHSASNCCNHGKLWREYAERVNKKYSDKYGKFITVSDDSGILDEHAKYVLRCENCGKLIFCGRKDEYVRDAINGIHMTAHLCPKGVGEGFGYFKLERIRK